MTETPHIFDEFLIQEDTPESRHQKRLRLEPLVFDILKRKYGSMLKGWWDAYDVPTEGDKAVVIVERRIHENLEFILHNAAYFARGWRIVIVCSDINLAWITTLLGKNKMNVMLIPCFKGIQDRQNGYLEYNKLLKTKEFYEALPAEQLLFLEMDSYIRKCIPDTWVEYDFIAAPYAWDEVSAGGGTSYRKRSSMIRICEEYSSDVWQQDIYLLNGARALGMKIPTFEEGLEAIVESCLYEDPVAVHQWWTFFSENDEDSKAIFHSLLTLQV